MYSHGVRSQHERRDTWKWLVKEGTICVKQGVIGDFFVQDQTVLDSMIKAVIESSGCKMSLNLSPSGAHVLPKVPPGLKNSSTKLEDDLQVTMTILATTLEASYNYISERGKWK